MIHQAILETIAQWTPMWFLTFLWIYAHRKVEAPACKHEKPVVQ